MLAVNRRMLKTHPWRKRIISCSLADVTSGCTTSVPTHPRPSIIPPTPVSHMPPRVRRTRRSGKWLESSWSKRGVWVSIPAHQDNNPSPAPSTAPHLGVLECIPPRVIRSRTPVTLGDWGHSGRHMTEAGANPHGARTIRARGSPTDQLLRHDPQSCTTTQPSGEERKMKNILGLPATSHGPTIRGCWMLGPLDPGVVPGAHVSATSRAAPSTPGNDRNTVRVGHPGSERMSPSPRPPPR